MRVKSRERDPYTIRMQILRSLKRGSVCTYKIIVHSRTKLNLHGKVYAKNDR